MATSIDFIYRIIDKFTAPLRKMAGASKYFTKDLDKAKNSLHQLGTRISQFSGVAMIAGLVAIGAAIKKGIQVASDLTEVQNVVDVTFRQNAETINKWSKGALNAYGLSELQAKKYNGTLGAMMKSSGITGTSLVNMSQKLTGLTGDFASFYNLPHDLAFTKIRSGISGEVEPLKQIGINMSVANLEAYALTQGITKKFKAMKQSEKVMLRYNYLLSVSKDAQGDFARTLETSYANQLRVLKTKFAEKLGNSMKKLLPYLIETLKGMNNFIDSIDAEKISKFIVAIFKMIKGFAKFVKFISPIAPIIFGIVAAWKAYRLIMMTVAAAQMAFNLIMTANPIGIIVTAIGVLIGLLILLALNWEKVKNAMNKALDNTFIKTFLAIAMPGFQILMETIRILVNNWDYIKKSFSEGGILKGIWAIGKAIVSAMLVPLQTMLEMVGKIPKVGKWAKDAAAGIKKFREGFWTKETKEGIDKMQQHIRKTRKKAADPIDLSKITEAHKKSLNKFSSEQLKARDKFAFENMYVSSPQIQLPGKREQTIKSETNISVFTEDNMKVLPFEKKGNTGYNFAGVM